MSTAAWRCDRPRPTYVASLHGPLTLREACYDLRQVHKRFAAGRIDREQWHAELDYVLSRYAPGALAPRLEPEPLSV